MIREYQAIMRVDTYADLPSKAGTYQLAIDLSTGVVYQFDGTIWGPSNKEAVLKSTVSVNALNTGSVKILTVPAGPLYFYPTQIIPRKVTISGTGTLPAITVGTNATSYNDIATSGLLTTVLGSISVSNGVPQMTNYSPAIPGGTDVYVNVTTSALVYTAYTIKFDILGFYDSTQP